MWWPKRGPSRPIGSPSQPRTGPSNAERKKPENGIRRTSKRELVQERKKKLAPRFPRARRKDSRLSLPSMSADVSGSSKNGMRNASSFNRSEKSAGGNKMSTAFKSNVSEKSANVKRNTNENGVCEHGTNVSRNGCGAE